MIQSLDRGIAILEYLSRRRSAGVTEMASAFDIDKSTVSRVMSTFSRRNIVYKDAATQKYYLSIGSLLFSYHIMSDHFIMKIAHPILQQLVSQTYETAHLCALHNGQVFVIDHIKSGRNKYMKDPTIPGMTEPFHCSAVGKVILAYMQPAEARHVLENNNMYSYTDKTINDIDKLMDSLDIIRENGYALDEEEYSQEVYCTAVPVFDAYGYVTHSIGITGQNNFIDNYSLFDRNLSYLREAGKQLSKEYRQHASVAI